MTIIYDHLQPTQGDEPQKVTAVKAGCLQTAVVDDRSTVGRTWDLPTVPKLPNILLTVLLLHLIGH